MNLSANPTKRQLADLLAACNDNTSAHILWVDQGGNVCLSPLLRGMLPSEFDRRADLRFRYETFNRGNKYTGPTAAADHQFVGRLYSALVRDWAGGLSGYSDDWDAR